MFEINDRSHDNIVGVEVSGKLTHEDYVSILIPKLNSLLETHEKLKVILSFGDFSGWEAEAAWDDASLGVVHRKHFEKLAIVGAPDYVTWGMWLFAPFMSGQVKSFDADQLDQAWQWVEIDD